MHAVKMQMPGVLRCHGLLFVDKLGPILNGVRVSGSSVGIAGWTVRDRIPAGTRFSARPD